MTAVSIGAPTSAQSRRAVTAAVIGNVLEWYDFAVYGYVAAIIGKNFFPGADETTELLKAFHNPLIEQAAINFLAPFHVEEEESRMVVHARNLAADVEAVNVVAQFGNRGGGDRVGRRKHRRATVLEASGSCARKGRALSKGKPHQIDVPCIYRSDGAAGVGEYQLREVHRETARGPGPDRNRCRQ